MQEIQADQCDTGGGETATLATAITAAMAVCLPLVMQ
jgi:hypothetical protein